MSPRSRRIVLIAPCRDEAQYMRRTLDALGRQTLPPALIVAVDDGSTDDSPRILEEYRRKLPNLRIVRRENRGVRAVGPGVVDAFYAGLAIVDLDEFDYLCKIDLDLDLPDRYFQILVERMEADPRLGACSGKPYYPHPRTGRLISEGCGDEIAIAATKFYRVDCFRQMGGFIRQVMWDGIANHRIRMLGWKAASWDDPAIRFTHLRPMGSSHKGILTGRMRHGFGQYFMGTGPVYMLASAVFRLATRPYLVGGAAMMWGYVKAAIDRTPRYDDLAFRSFLRRYHRQTLLRGKHAATRALDDSWEDRALPVGSHSTGSDTPDPRRVPVDVPP
jgi:glycosyltransferase involved in cell wall biosynthesis